MFKIRLMIVMKDEKNKNMYKEQPKNYKDLCGIIATFRVLEDDVTEPLNADMITHMFNTERCSEVEIPEKRINFKDISVGKIFELLKTHFNSGFINTNADIEVTVGTRQVDLLEDFIPREKFRTTSNDQYVPYYRDKIKELKYKFV